LLFYFLEIIKKYLTQSLVAPLVSNNFHKKYHRALAWHMSVA